MGEPKHATTACYLREGLKSREIDVLLFFVLQTFCAGGGGAERVKGGGSWERAGPQEWKRKREEKKKKKKYEKYKWFRRESIWLEVII